MKALNPSQREKKRYLLISSAKLSGSVLQKKVECAILEFVGILGMSKTGLSFIKSGKDSAVICINREAVDSVRASLVSVSR